MLGPTELPSHAKPRESLGEKRSKRRLSGSDPSASQAALDRYVSKAERVRSSESGSRPVGLVDLVDRGAHEAGEFEQRHTGCDLERRERMAERVGRCAKSAARTAGVPWSATRASSGARLSRRGTTRPSV